MPRRMSEVGELGFRKYFRLLTEDWGFDREGARVFASALANKALNYKWNGKQFGQLRRTRREEVMERYEAGGGELKEPNFVTNDTASRAVRLESQAMSDGGFKTSRMTDWWTKYYYGMNSKEEWKDMKEAFRIHEKEMKEGGWALEANV